MSNANLFSPDRVVDSVTNEARSHAGSGVLLLLFEAACIFAALTLVGIHGWRISVASTGLSVVSTLVVLIAWVAADFLTGVVHWAADTWGKESTPFWGPRFLTPFRVHHVTPKSFLECGFFDTNGDTAMLSLPILLAAFLISLDSPSSINLALFLVTLAAIGAATNQIHQWSHMDHPPWFARILQRMRIILSPQEHSRHHRHPHDSRYCISSGVCNPFLDWIGFFTAMERIITWATGVQPRHDEESHRSSLRDNRLQNSYRFKEPVQ